MDFNDTPEEAAFRAEVRKWIQENAPHHLREKLEASTFGKSALSGEEFIRESKAWQKKKADAGWACLHWPKEYGGRGASPIERVIWGQEEGVYARLSTIFLIGHGMCGPTLMAYASEEQKRRYLPPLASGEEIWCQLFSEPAAGSDLAGIVMRADRDGDDWVLNGQKIWSSGAQYSDYAIIVTRSDFDAPKHQGLTFFFVDMKSPGIEVRPIQQITGGSDFNEVYFTDVRVPDGQRLGEPGDGWRVCLTTLMNERAAIGGGMSTGFDEFFDWAAELETDAGRLIDDPAVREKMAAWHVRENGLRYTNFRKLSALSRGETPGPESSIGKLVAGRTMQEIANFALELQGLGGVVDSPDLTPLNGKFQFMFLRSPATRIEGGSDEILRNIIAERVLGLPGDIRVDKDVPFKDIPKGK